MKITGVATAAGDVADESATHLMLSQRLCRIWCESASLLAPTLAALWRRWRLNYGL